jgi:hypothetical protein
MLDGSWREIETPGARCDRLTQSADEYPQYPREAGCARQGRSDYFFFRPRAFRAA